MSKIPSSDNEAIKIFICFLEVFKQIKSFVYISVFREISHTRGFRLVSDFKLSREKREIEQRERERKREGNQCMAAFFKSCSLYSLKSVSVFEKMGRLPLNSFDQ